MSIKPEKPMFLFGHVVSTYPAEICIPFILIETEKNKSFKEMDIPFANQLDIVPTIVDLPDIPIPGI